MEDLSTTTPIGIETRPGEVVSMEATRPWIVKGSSSGPAAVRAVQIWCSLAAHLLVAVCTIYSASLSVAKPCKPNEGIGSC